MSHTKHREGGSEIVRRDTVRILVLLRVTHETLCPHLKPLFENLKNSKHTSPLCGCTVSRLSLTVCHEVHYDVSDEMWNEDND